jgi:hypothetical protein
MCYYGLSPLVRTSLGSEGNFFRVGSNTCQKRNSLSVVDLLFIVVLFAAALLVDIPGASAQANIVRFAVIGDYGTRSTADRDVADLVKSWNPDLAKS